MDRRDDDWRDTLYFWHGKLSWVGGERNVMSWRGQWLSTVSNIVPLPKQFSSSFNYFELNFDIEQERARRIQQGRFGDIDILKNLASNFRGHYLMEPPDGSGYRRAYRDEEHEFLFDSVTQDGAACLSSMDAENTSNHASLQQNGDDISVPRTNNSLMKKMFLVVRKLQTQQPNGLPLDPGPYLLIACKGKNEFGRFVALGQCRIAVRPSVSGQGTIDDGLELTVARRYIRDDDSRYFWPLHQFLQSISISNVRGSRLCPWEHSLPCRLPSDVIAQDNKRQQEEYQQQGAFGTSSMQLTTGVPPPTYYSSTLNQQPTSWQNEGGAITASNNRTHNTTADHPALCFQPPPPKGPPFEDFHLPHHLSVYNGFVIYENEIWRKRPRDD